MYTYGTTTVNSFDTSFGKGSTCSGAVLATPLRLRAGCRVRWLHVGDELTAGVVVVAAASGFNKVMEFDYWLAQFVNLVPRDEYRLWMRFGYGGGHADIYV
jgi:hypothetical protein